MCMEACNANGEGLTKLPDLPDAIYTLNFLFAGGGRPPGDYPACDISVDNCETPICNT